MDKKIGFMTHRWGWLAVGAGAALFAMLAGYPYLKASASLLAKGETVSAENIRYEIKMDEKAAKEAEKMKEIKEKGDAYAAGEIKRMLILPDGRLLVGGKYGLFEVSADGQTKPFEVPITDLKAMAVAPDGSLWAADKYTLHRLHEGSWSQIYQGKVEDIVFRSNDEILIGSKHIGLLVSKDGGENWHRILEAVEEKKHKEDHAGDDKADKLAKAK